MNETKAVCRMCTHLNSEVIEALKTWCAKKKKSLKMKYDAVQS